MKYVGYYNGEIGPLEEMKIPMLDRAVYFGDGCYDATTFANNNIFAADDHLDRFYNSCKLLEIPFEMSREELRAELQKCIDANEIDHGMLYWQCSRGTTYRGHQFPPATVKPNLMIFTVPCDLIPFDKTFRLISMEDTRFLHCNIKTLNLIPSVIAYQRCIDQVCNVLCGQFVSLLAGNLAAGSRSCRAGSSGAACGTAAAGQYTGAEGQSGQSGRCFVDGAFSHFCSFLSCF